MRDSFVAPFIGISSILATSSKVAGKEGISLQFFGRVCPFALIAHSASMHKRSKSVTSASIRVLTLEKKTDAAKETRCDAMRRSPPQPKLIELENGF